MTQHWLIFHRRVSLCVIRTGTGCAMGYNFVRYISLLVLHYVVNSCVWFTILYVVPALGVSVYVKEATNFRCERCRRYTATKSSEPCEMCMLNMADTWASWDSAHCEADVESRQLMYMPDRKQGNVLFVDELLNYVLSNCWIGKYWAFRRTEPVWK